MDVRISHMGDLKDEDYLPMNDEYLIRFVFIGSWFTPFWSRICRNIILQFLSSGKPNKVTPTPSVPTGPLLANMEDGGCHVLHILMRSCWVKRVLLRNHWYRLLTGSHRYLPSPNSVLKTMINKKRSKLEPHWHVVEQSEASFSPRQFDSATVDGWNYFTSGTSSLSMLMPIFKVYLMWSEVWTTVFIGSTPQWQWQIHVQRDSLLKRCNNPGGDWYWGVSPKYSTVSHHSCPVAKTW